MAKGRSSLTRKQIQKKQYFSSQREEKKEQSKDDSSGSHSSGSHRKKDESNRLRSDKRNPVRVLYEDHYKKLMIFPALMLILAFAMIGVQYYNTGEVMNFGVSITGGISITVPDVEDFEVEDVEGEMREAFPGSDANVRRLVSPDEIGVTVEISNVEAEELTSFMRERFGDFDDYSLEETGSTLGDAFFRQSIMALVFAFALMGLVVFISFRYFVPSAAVMLSAVFDIIVTVGIVNLMGMRITTAGLAAFLMLIGYSVDTDILMSNKLMKSSKRDTMKNLYSAMKTGLMMEVTTVAVLVVGILISNSEVLVQIMTIVLIGILVDLVSTWIQNAGMMRWYLEKHEF